MRGTGWRGYLRSSDERPRLTRDLVRRVIGYARPYRLKIIEMFILILATTGLGLLTPLIMRYLIDYVIPSGNVEQLALLAIGLLVIPSLSGLFRVWQRRLNAQV